MQRMIAVERLAREDRFVLLRGRKPAVRVDLDPSARYGRLLVTVPDPEATVAAIHAAISV